MTTPFADAIGPSGALGAGPDARLPDARKLTGWRAAARVFFSNKLGVVGLTLVVAVLLFSFVGPLVHHTDQTHPDLLMLSQAPSSEHLLGTDDVGYDVLGRLMVAGRTSLIIGVGAAILATIFGVLWGATAGFAGGWLDSLMMRIVDMFIAIPALFFLLVLAAIFQPTLGMLIVVVAMVSWLYPARLIRAETLSLRDRDFIAAVRVAGGSNMRILIRHIIPNTIGTIVTNLTFQVADAILLVAVLSFLGLGVQPPSTDWGAMLTKGTAYIFSGAWWQIYPAGIAIVLTVLGFNLIGDAMRDAFEVRLRRR
jgi:peptide/nickel transport system permease protein